MYTCSQCGNLVEVDGINKPKCCEGATILCGLSGKAHGNSFMKVEVLNNNLSETSADIAKQFFTYLISSEVFKNGKSRVFVDKTKIIDSDTQRAFTCSVTIEECSNS